MKIKLSQNYSYANNSSGELINVSIAKHSEKYFCPICGELMTPHMGKVRRWHFAHKNIENCSYESYLHKIAKLKIRQAFLSSEHFLLSYKAKALCSLECPFICSPKCESEKPVEFDLRRFYDTCELEATYHQFRADLLLRSSTNPKLHPVLIEIMVTHKCTEDKISDGVRIIEIPIQSEKQIDDIVDNCELTAVRHNQANYRYYDELKITLYNFNKAESFSPRNHIIYLFWLNNQGQFSSITCHCYEISQKLPPNVHYYISEYATQFKEIFQGFSKRGVKIRNCFLCKFSQKVIGGYRNSRICTLYKKHNLPQKPSPHYAISCPHYKEDIEYQQDTAQTEQSLSTGPTDYSPKYKFYYHICKDIL